MLIPGQSGSSTQCSLVSTCLTDGGWGLYYHSFHIFSSETCDLSWVTGLAMRTGSLVCTPAGPVTSSPAGLGHMPCHLNKIYGGFSLSLPLSRGPLHVLFRLKLSFVEILAPNHGPYYLEHKWLNRTGIGDISSRTQAHSDTNSHNL